MVSKGLVVVGSAIGKAELAFDPSAAKSQEAMLLKDYIYYDKLSGLPKLEVSHVQEYQAVEFESRMLYMPKTISLHVLGEGEDFDPQSKMSSQVALKSVEINAPVDESAFQIPGR